MSVLNLKILSFKSVIFNSVVESVVLPGLDGDISITAPRNFAYLLNSGMIYVFSNSKLIKRFFVYNGHFQVKNNNIIVNTLDDIMDLDTIEVNAINEKILHYNNLLNNANNEVNKALYLNKITFYKNAIESKNIFSYK